MAAHAGRQKKTSNDDLTDTGRAKVFLALKDEKQPLCSLLDGSGQEVYLGHTGECKLVTTAAHQVLPTWIGTYS